DIIRPHPYRMDSTHIHRKCSKTGTFRADYIRPYGSNVRCLKTVNNNLWSGRPGGKLALDDFWKKGYDL
ncbi:MAG: hypothetical protein SPE19_03850, partial [Candidatus Faecousia sp.]|nr:hypothetical protein [Candidatus Faecousia sp.]